MAMRLITIGIFGRSLTGRRSRKRGLIVKPLNKRREDGAHVENYFDYLGRFGGHYWFDEAYG